MKKTEYLQGLSAFLGGTVANNYDRQVPSLKKCAIVAGSAFEKCFKKSSDKSRENPRG